MFVYFDRKQICFNLKLTVFSKCRVKSLPKNIQTNISKFYEPLNKVMKKITISINSVYLLSICFNLDHLSHY